MEAGTWGGWNKISAGAADSLSGSPTISGNLGIGIAPVSRLHVKSTYDSENTGICIDASDGTNYQLKIYPYVVAGGKVGYKFRVYNQDQTTAYDGLRINNYGYIGIGINTPSKSSRYRCRSNFIFFICLFWSI